MAAPEPGIQRRIRFFGILFVLAFLAIVARSVYLQVIIAPELQQHAEQQSQRIIKLAPQRGSIFDRNGGKLAGSLDTESLYADPLEVEDPAAVAKRLAPLLKTTPQKLEQLLSRDKRFVWLERKLEPAVAAQIREEFGKQLVSSGLNFVTESKRYYPQSQVASHVLGFIGLDPKGLEGLELEYDQLLQGEPGLLVSACDAKRRPMASEGQEIVGGEKGRNLYLTVDRSLQYIAEKELARVVKDSGAVGGTVVMMEPASGRILALASQPDYNPNAGGQYRPQARRNRTVTDVYEPGSTFKPFLMAGVLEEGVATLSEKIYCENGSFTVGGKTIRDHKGYKDLTLEEVLKHSSNIGCAKLGKRLGRERFYSYIRDFGFGEQTGIDLPGEVSGILRSPSRWFEIDLANISFGQGVSVTPLQITTAMAAIANGGLLMEPYIVERITDAEGNKLQQRLPQVRRRVVSEETARIVRDMMVSVTETDGTGSRGALLGYQVAGKTGTAQKVDPVTGGYSPDKRVSSFVGFVPAESPALVISVTVDEPQGKTYGGLVAAPVFARIAGQSLSHLNILPKGSVIAVSETETANEPLPDLAALIPDAGTVTTDGVIMPNFYGMSYRQVLGVVEENNLDLKLSGSGQVVEQSPAPGRTIHYGKEAWVRLGA